HCMLRKVVIAGPESTGKTTLARRLASHFGTVFVEEYGRIYCEKFGNECDAFDLCHIAAGQLLLEEQAMAVTSPKLLICDTDVLVTQTYAELYLGKSPDVIVEMARRQSYDLYLLLSPDVPWSGDAIRLFENRREWHFLRLKELLDEQHRSYAVIAGSFEQRFERAVLLIRNLLRETV
ncbi:MAG: AAA family ATPase, partial [Siphonobacter aquaeclarae]|nr:AAA family ATPase [Siphonobacter aquaeclarae]